LTDLLHFNALSPDTLHGKGLFVYGLIFDCRGSSEMAARGVDLVTPWDAPLVYYWPEKPVQFGEPLPFNTGTALTGVFSVPTDSVPPGLYRIELRDRATREVRSQYLVEIVADENVVLFLFPTTSSE
jgi:hypothetical protein